jgi:hypothetical protein
MTTRDDTYDFLAGEDAVIEQGVHEPQPLTAGAGGDQHQLAGLADRRGGLLASGGREVIGGPGWQPRQPRGGRPGPR